MAFGDLFCTMSALLATCKKQMARAKKKLGMQRSTSTKLGLNKTSTKAACRGAGGFLPFRRVKKIAGGKGIKNPNTRKLRNIAENGGDDHDDDDDRRNQKEEEAGVWRRTILMGEKCRPLNFSGAIHYDSAGRQLSEVPTPRSPRTPGTPGQSPFAPAGFHIHSGVADR